MDISIIIVEYKDIDLVKRAVNSVLKNMPNCFEYEIILISNSSYGKDEQKYAERSWKECKIIFQGNAGFSRAVNMGINLSEGRYIMLLNPDAEFSDDSLIEAVNFMKTHPKTAVIGPKILDNAAGIQDSCRQFMTFGILFNRMIARFLKQTSGAVLETRDYNATDRVDWVSGACMLVRRTAIDQVGNMDDRYFMYVEDMDWCRSFKRYGWDVWYLPDWCIKHNAGRGSSGMFCFFNRLMWIHIFSFIKYKIKWVLNEN